MPKAIASSNNPVALGGTLNLISGGGVSYSWSGPGGFTSSQQNPSTAGFNSNEAGIYTVTVTTAGGCISSATTSVNVLGPLNGAYTIGGTTPSYSSLATAISDLNLRGISGAVTFNIRTGSYAGGQIITAFAGSGIYPVIFQPDNGANVQVTISASQPAGVTLSGVNNIEFLSLTFFAPVSSTYTSYGVSSAVNCAGLQITNCTFSNIWYPIYLNNSW